MASNESKSEFKPPYTTYKSFVNFINRLQSHHLPPQIDRSLMTYLSGSVQASLMASLKSLALINDASEPTESFSRLHDNPSDSTHYKNALREIVLRTYPFLSDKDFDVRRATARQLEDKFRDYEISGSTLEKAVAFFLAATKDAGIEISPLITARKSFPTKKGASAPRGKKPKSKPESTEYDERKVDEKCPPEDGIFMFEIPVFGKATARISLPENMTGSEWQLIKTVLEAQATHLLMRNAEDVE